MIANAMLGSYDPHPEKWRRSHLYVVYRLFKHYILNHCVFVCSRARASAPAIAVTWHPVGHELIEHSHSKACLVLFFFLHFSSFIRSSNIISVNLTDFLFCEGKKCYCMSIHGIIYAVNNTFYACFWCHGDVLNSTRKKTRRIKNAEQHSKRERKSVKRRKRMPVLHSLAECWYSWRVERVTSWNRARARAASLRVCAYVCELNTKSPAPRWWSWLRW